MNVAFNCHLGGRLRDSEGLRPSSVQPRTMRDIHPRAARRMFFKAKKGTVRDSTYRCYKHPTEQFIDYLETNGIDSMRDVDGFLIETWKNELKDRVKLVTVRNYVTRIRVFIKWCEASNVVESGLYDAIIVPDVPEEQARSTEVVTAEQSERISTRLMTYEYGTRKHAMWELQWHVGCRVGGLVSLDLTDFSPGDAAGPVLRFRNRAESDTTLKNGRKSERDVSLSDDVAGVLEDYIKMHRRDVRDDHERRPLFTTRNGRVHRNRWYKHVVGLTRPCKHSDRCPEGRQIATCDAAEYKKNSHDCPFTVGTHAIRRGSITNHLNRGWPMEKVSERCDVTIEVLEKHYDARTLEDKRSNRRKYLDLL